MYDITKIQNDNISYFASNDWEYVFTDKGVCFFKGNSLLHKDLIIPNGKSRNISFIDKGYDIFKSKTVHFFEERIGFMKQLKPLNVYDGYGENAFVSTGFEYYYDYLYKNKMLFEDNTFVIQPVVRFKLDMLNESNYGHNNLYDYSGIAFNNLSIVDRLSNDNLIDKIEIMIDYLSMLGIYAKRINFVIEDKVRKKDNDVQYLAVKFFVDNLEIGDILQFKTNNGYLSEFGFGLERLYSRLVNQQYNKIILDDYDCGNSVILRECNFITLISMIDDSRISRGAKSRINRVIKSMCVDKEHKDIIMVFKNYLYWSKILEDSDYLNFEKVTEKYLVYSKKGLKK